MPLLDIGESLLERLERNVNQTVTYILANIHNKIIYATSTAVQFIYIYTCKLLLKYQMRSNIQLM